MAEEKREPPKFHPNDDFQVDKQFKMWCQSFDDLEDFEMQHNIALHVTTKKVMSEFNRIYDETFDDMNTVNEFITGAKTISIAELKASALKMPDPMGELLYYSTEYMKEAQASRVFPDFNFISCDLGSIARNANRPRSNRISDIFEQDRQEYLPQSQQNPWGQFPQQQLQSNPQYGGIIFGTPMQQHMVGQPSNEQLNSSSVSMYQQQLQQQYLYQQQQAEYQRKLQEHEEMVRKSVETSKAAQQLLIDKANEAAQAAHDAQIAAGFQPTPFTPAVLGPTGITFPTAQSNSSTAISATPNASSSSASYSSQGYVHRVPKLDNFTLSTFTTYINEVETLHSTQKKCEVHIWLPVASQPRKLMYYALLGDALVSDEAEFNALLMNTPLFIEKAREYLHVHNATIKGDMSAIDIVRKTLKLKFQTTHNDEKLAMNKQWVTFATEHPSIASVITGTDQTNLVEEFIKINNGGGVSAMQRYVFAFLRDRQPPITTLEECYMHLLQKWKALDAIADVASQIGMSFTGGGYKTAFPDTRKRGWTDDTSSATNQQTWAQKIKSDPPIKPPQVFDIYCTQCGIGGHTFEECKADPNTTFINKNTANAYADSLAWKKCLKEYPNMLAITGYPRIPKQSQIVLHERPPTAPTSHAGGGGRGRGGRDSGGRNYRGGRGRSSRSGGRQKCEITPTSHTCDCTNNAQVSHDDDVDDVEHIANIAKHTTLSTHHYNKITIINPNATDELIIATTYALIDTGALHGSYVGTWILAHELRAGNKFKNSQICSPINNTCTSLTDSVIACVNIYDADKKYKFNFTVELKVLSSLDDREYGIIIGLPDIKKHNLLSRFANQFNDCKVDIGEGQLKRNPVNVDPIGNSISDKFANLSEELVWVKHASGWLESPTSPSAHTRTPANKRARHRKNLRHEDMLHNAYETTSPRIFKRPQHYDEDEEVIQRDHWDDAWQKNDDKSSTEKDVIDTIVDKINSKDESFKIEAHAFLSEYRDLFSRTLSATPALLQPLTIEIDRAKFETPQAQGPPRMMTVEKDIHMEKFITEGLKSNVIRPSNARYYSQVHLVVKPQTDAETAKSKANLHPAGAAYTNEYDCFKNVEPHEVAEDDIEIPSLTMNVDDVQSTTSAPHQARLTSPLAPIVRKWRTTIDYRHYNKCIVKQHWPLPNIDKMIERIGKKKHGYYAKLDMTMGYWQAPLSEESKAFTAFICFMGIFEWNRAPMGTQPAGGYFQQMIAFVVLLGLTYTILESYIDDIFVHAATKKELFENLALVFTRFRKHKITFNPDKVHLSDTEMEFVGHEFSSNGVKFSDSKRNGVGDIPLPKTKGDLKKFLGVANYFRKHVRNHSMLAQPLQSLMPGYTRTQRNHIIVWPEEKKLLFQDLRDNVANCPKLFFMNDIWDIGLETDASDYGIGAFLFQIDPEDNSKVPIQFVSKSLTGAQLRWSTPEKEMYAKYYAVNKLEYILGDRPFTWWTDHKNNILNKSTGSDKVLRWQLYLQDFDITDAYIKGEDNEITDSWSRLCVGVRNKSDRDKLLNENQAQKLSHLCEVSDSTEYLTMLEEHVAAPIPTEYLNLMVRNYIGVEQLAVLAQAPSLSDETYAKLAKVHNSTVGHLGVERTLYRLKRLNDTWPAMRIDISLFIKQCPCCQKMSRIKVPIHTSPFTTASYGLMKKLSMDCIGPLKETEDGYTHILAVIDNFSRYTALYPVKGPSAIEIAQATLIHIGTFGCPDIIQMDNGTEFINETIKETIKLLGTSQAAILAYSKEENAIVERCNKESMRHIRAMVFEVNKKSSWKIHIPLAQRILNSEVHSRTGVSPNDLVFGGKLDLQGGFLHTTAVQSTDVHIATWSSDMLALQDKLVDLAQIRQREKDEKHLKKEESSLAITQFRPNSFVLVQYPDSAMGPRAPTKLHTHWKGPMRVISNIGAEYILHDLVKNKNIPIHVKRLKVFEHDPRRTDPLAIAARDNEEDEVEYVIAHTGDPKRKSDMDFQVRWAGYDESEDSWLPWSEVRNIPALHSYLRANNMVKLIPKEHL